VAAAFTAGGLERCGAGITGEVVGCREAGDVTDVAEDLPGDDGSDARMSVMVECVSLKTDRRPDATAADLSVWLQ
jgi:hypothetical protein